MAEGNQRRYPQSLTGALQMAVDLQGHGQSSDSVEGNPSPQPSEQMTEEVCMIITSDMSFHFYSGTPSLFSPFQSIVYRPVTDNNRNLRHLT